MARNRQRAKERQARRKAQEGDGSANQPKPQSSPPPKQPEPDAVEPDVVEAEAVEAEVEPPELDLEPHTDPIIPSLEAPPQDLGSSAHPRDLPPADEEYLEEAEDAEAYDPAEDDVGDGSGEATGKAKGRGPRFWQFLKACWAELQRVQWPTRQQTIQLTGVVLGFVVIAGGFLGGLDAIASEVVKAIL